MVTEPQRQKKSYATERKVRTIELKILYFGTPVALLSSLNEDGWKKSCAKTQVQAVSFRAAQVCSGRAHSSGERSGKAGASQGNARFIGKRALPRCINSREKS
jgi:hypothetical protein